MVFTEDEIAAIRRFLGYLREDYPSGAVITGVSDSGVTVMDFAEAAQMTREFSVQSPELVIQWSALSDREQPWRG